jgi:hypothetical protein
VVQIHARHAPLAKGNHELVIHFDTTPFGELSLKVNDAIVDEPVKRLSVPLDKENNYADIVRKRRSSCRADRRRSPSTYSFGGDTQGNVENFSGVARCRSASPVLSMCAANTRRGISSFRWPPPKAPWWPRTTAA